MSDLLTDRDLKTEGETAREPKKAWRNKWRVKGRMGVTVYQERDLDGWLCAGVHWGQMWPSEDSARTAAQCILQAPWDDYRPGDEDHLVWLGTFPKETP